MLKIVDEFQIGKYMVLKLDGNIQDTKDYRKYRIDGKIYNPVPVYDMGNNVIAVESENSFFGKTVDFV